MMNSRTSMGGGILTFALVGAALAGCGGDPGGGESEETFTRKSAVTSTAYTDWSGLVTVHVKICDWSEVTSSPSSVCELDPNQVLIGGGAEVEGSADGGGLLWGSVPTFGQAWLAGSRDLVTPYPHRIRAYAIGLELADMDFQTLDSLVTRTPQTRGNNSRPAAQVFVPDGHIMLGGGGATSEGIFLTDTRPEGDFSWVAIGKDHQIPANGSASAWVISIPRCLNGLWSGGCLRSNHDSTWETSVSTGYGMVSVDIPPGWVPAGLGAQANWTTYGRLLTDAFPTNSDGGPGATVFSKDHNFVDGSFTAVYAISLSRDPMGVP